MSDDALNDFCDWLESQASHTIACPADCPLCLAADKIRALEAKVEELTGAWKDSMDGVERIAFYMEAPNPYTPRFIMWVNQMRNEFNRIKAGG